MQATLSAGQSGIGFKRARDIAAPAHLGALRAARPCIQAMIQDAVSAGLLPKRPFESRLDAVIETATSTYLEALDDEEKTTAKLHVQKAAQAAEAWQHTVDGHNGPVVTNPTVSELEHPSSASQDDDSDDVECSSTHRKSRLSAPQLQEQLSRLSDRTRLWRLKNTHEDRRLVPQDACAGSVLPPHDNIPSLSTNRSHTNASDPEKHTSPPLTPPPPAHNPSSQKQKANIAPLPSPPSN